MRPRTRWPSRPTGATSRSAAPRAPCACWRLASWGASSPRRRRCAGPRTAWATASCSGMGSAHCPCRLALSPQLHQTLPSATLPATQGLDAVVCLRYSPQGDLLAAGDSGGGVVIYAADRGCGRSVREGWRAAGRPAERKLAPAQAPAAARAASAGKPATHAPLPRFPCPQLHRAELVCRVAWRGGDRDRLQRRRRAAARRDRHAGAGAGGRHQRRTGARLARPCALPAPGAATPGGCCPLPQVGASSAASSLARAPAPLRWTLPRAASRGPATRARWAPRSRASRARARAAARWGPSTGARARPCCVRQAAALGWERAQCPASCT